MVEPGRRCLEDRYELGQLIASGGMGEVWRGWDVLLGRPVAVKVLRSEYTGDPTFLARFRAEAQHAASLSHPNIAAVYDYGEATAQDGSGETLAYLVMELIEGPPLSTILREQGGTDVPTALSILRQTACALAEAHRVGLVHRDVKPGNILVRADGRVKITDFGIAWSAGSVPLTRTGQVIGTPQYLSPEQAEGSGATPASDVYALGLVGYELLTGHTAFDGDNAVTIALKQLRQEPEPLPGTLPACVRSLIGRALVKDPTARIPDGAAFVAAVDEVLAGREPAELRTTVAAELPTAATAGTGGTAAPVAVAAGGAATVSGPSRATRAARRRAARSGPPTGGRRRLGLVLLPLLTLLAGAGIAAVVVQGVLSDRPASPAAAATQPTAEPMVLDVAEFRGRPVDEVAVQLAAFGLTVERREEVTGDLAPGLVTTVDPAGVGLLPGDRVTVAFAVAPPEAPDDDAARTEATPAEPESATDEGPAPVGSVQDAGSTPSTSPEPSPAAPTTTSEPSTTGPTSPAAGATPTTEPTPSSTVAEEPPASSSQTSPPARGDGDKGGRGTDKPDDEDDDGAARSKTSGGDEG